MPRRESLVETLPWNRKQVTVGPVVTAPSVRRDELFRATRTGLERVQSGKLRSGSKFNRTDVLPYGRITSLSYEEKVITHGSRVLGALGVILLLFGIAVPALSSVNLGSVLPGLGGRIPGLTGSLALPSIAGLTVGVALLASKFPRKSRERWWQVKGQDMTLEDQRGWQVAAGEGGAEELVNAVREGIANIIRAQASKSQ